MEDITFTSLMKRFKLREEVCNEKVRDTHIEDISRSCSCQWKRLPSYLGMEDIVAEDIDREQKNEDEKRLAFFKQWKQRRGSDATYKCLTNALLKIGRREDAEYVCMFVKSTDTPLHLSNSPSNTDSDYIPIKDLDSDVKGDLEQQLDQYPQQIIERYASFVRRTRVLLKEKGVTVTDSRDYLMNLRAFNLHEKKSVLLLEHGEELRSAKTIEELRTYFTSSAQNMLLSWIMKYFSPYSMNTALTKTMMKN